MKTPNGLAEIVAAFGDITQFVRSDATIDPKWEQRMVSMPIPFSIPLSWDANTRVSKLRVHNLIVPNLDAVFKQALVEGLQSAFQSYGGGYAFRAKRGSSKYSTHCWGIALDFNVNTNQMGKPGDMNPKLVEIFRANGFKWGGDWTGANCDPMHFQLATGY